jgi:nicotinamidase-related amidase
MGDRTVLLIVDMQVGNFDESAPVYEGDALLSNTKALIVQAREAGVPVIYIQHCGPEGAIDELGEPGWEIHPAIYPVERETIIQKCHPDAFQDTELQNELELGDTKKLVITGIQTEYCVDTTCRRAYSLGYEVVLVQDGHGTWDSNHLSAQQIIAHHNETLGGWFAELKETNQIRFDAAV